jgi:hypothetical protein
MTILNTTQGRIIENREKIDDIIDVIHNVARCPFFSSLGSLKCGGSLDLMSLSSIRRSLGSITLGDKWPMNSIFSLSCNCPK